MSNSLAFKGLWGSSVALASGGVLDSATTPPIFICLHGALVEIPSLGGGLVAVPSLGGRIEDAC